MMKPTPPSPQKSLERVIFIARFDGASVLLVAGLLGIVMAMLGDYLGAFSGAIIAGAGAAEFHGTVLLKRGDRRGMDWLVRSQLVLLIAILGYCAFRMLRPELAPLRALITPDVREQFEAIGGSIDQFIALFYRLFYTAVALASLVYQGGLAFYYSRRRATAAAVLAAQ